jgi:putative nucleotidyltransferase with HDIG domain
MNIFEQLGWRQRKSRPVGRGLESVSRSKDASWRWSASLKLGLFLALVGLAMVAFPHGEVFEYTVQVGDTWRQPTLEAPFNFPIHKDPEVLAQEREAARRKTPPYFQKVTNAQQRVSANRDTLSAQFERIMDAYASFRYHQMRGQSDQARDDSLRYLNLRRNALVSLPSAQWDTLAVDYVQQLPGLTDTPSRSRTAPDARLDRRLLREAYDLSSQLLSLGVMNRSRDSIRTDRIIVRNEDERMQESVSKDNLYGLNEAYRYVEDQFREQFSDRPTYVNIAFAMFRDIFEPSLRYMRGETMQERQRQAQQVAAFRGGVEKGDIIVRKGEQITAEIKRTLTSLERERTDQAPRQLLGRQLAGEGLFGLLTFAFLFVYLYLLRPDVWTSDRHMILLALVLALPVVLLGVVVRIPWANLYAVPIALASVVITIIFNSRLALFSTLVLAFLGGQMLGLDLEYTFASFLAGALAIFSVRDIKNRGQFVVSAVLAFVGYALVLTASWLYLDASVERFSREVMYAAIGASFTITSYLVLWALERVFDITTDLTLLELSDTNNALLKDLSLQAPGSFNHSLQVANLAEAAADRIGAHALLTRVGALYHDIGKMRQPEYFVENQRAGSNPHDSIKPRMSALVIARHVKDGLEMAKDSGLPERVYKFIPMHHGTARIEYFYRKAIEQTSENDSPVLESEFRYPGPRPDSKETGILMLADSVEAASRSLDEPTHKRLKSLIELIVRERIEDDQLDNTDLTFRDLSQIKDTFLQMLMGIYHVRVKYPDQEEETDEETDEAPVISTEGRTEDEGVSVAYARDEWGAFDANTVAKQLQRSPGVRSPRAPKQELAQMSPHHRAQAVGNGVPAVRTPPPTSTGDSAAPAARADDARSTDASPDGTHTETDEGKEKEPDTEAPVDDEDDSATAPS